MWGFLGPSLRVPNSPAGQVLERPGSSVVGAAKIGSRVSKIFSTLSERYHMTIHSCIKTSLGPVIDIESKRAIICGNNEFNFEKSFI